MVAGWTERSWRTQGYPLWHSIDAHIQETAHGRAEHGEDDGQRDIHFAVF